MSRALTWKAPGRQHAKLQQRTCQAEFADKPRAREARNPAPRSGGRARCVEDAREDLHFAASSWKTWIQKKEMLIKCFLPASSVFHKTTARSSVLTRLAHVFPENTRRGSAVAVVSWSTGSVLCARSRRAAKRISQAPRRVPRRPRPGARAWRFACAAAARQEGPCKHHGKCPLPPRPVLRVHRRRGA